MEKSQAEMKGEIASLDSANRDKIQTVRDELAAILARLTDQTATADDRDRAIILLGKLL